MPEDLRKMAIDPDATSSLTGAQAHTLRAIIVNSTAEEFHFATDRVNAWLPIGDDLTFLLSRRAEPILVTKESLDWALLKYHPAPKFPTQTKLKIERALLAMPEENRPWIALLKVVVMDVLRSKMQFIRIERPSEMWYGKYQEDSTEDRVWIQAAGENLKFDKFESALRQYASSFSSEGTAESCLLLFWGDWVVTCSIEMSKARIVISLTVDKPSGWRQRAL